MVHNFAHFVDTLKLGVKSGLEDQTRAQRQGDSLDNSFLQLISIVSWWHPFIVPMGQSSMINISAFDSLVKKIFPGIYFERPNQSFNFTSHERELRVGARRGGKSELTQS